MYFEQLSMHAVVLCTPSSHQIPWLTVFIDRQAIIRFSWIDESMKDIGTSDSGTTVKVPKLHNHKSEGGHGETE